MPSSACTPVSRPKPTSPIPPTTSRERQSAYRRLGRASYQLDYRLIAYRRRSNPNASNPTSPVGSGTIVSTYAVSSRSVISVAA